MRIGVISDTHIPDRAGALPKELVEKLKPLDMLIDCGDLVELRVLKELRKICGDVKAVSGNMDPAEVREVLPDKLIFKAGKFTIGVSHGIGAPKTLPGMMRQLFKKDKVDLIVFGHSHQPLIDKSSRPWLFNPGSPTDTVFAPYKSFGIIEIDDTMELEIIRL